MTRKAASRKQGNRHTQVWMTAREAQTLAGCLRKIIRVRKAMEKRGVYFPDTDKLKNAEQSIVDAVMSQNRLDEIRPYHLDL